MMTLYISLLIYLKYLEIRPEYEFYQFFPNRIVCAGHCRCAVHDTECYLASARILKQSALVKFRREGKTIYYSLADDHVATIMAQGLEHVCE